MKKMSLLIGVAAVSLAMMTTGCTTQYKGTTQKDLTRAAIVDTGSGVVLYPAHYYSVTNGSGQVMTYAEYAAITSSNKQPFSLADFFAGYGDTRSGFTDAAYESHSGSGRALLADSKYTQLTSDFASGSRFAGTSQLSVGAIELSINTNAITASGNAGNQLIQGIGAAAGQFVNKSATGKP
jgi:hypothetical protein